jgi:hypothetical protein
MDARRSAYSMLLAKAVIRVGIAIPANAEFELYAVSDPYGYAGNNANGNELSLFRRPLPATNLAFLSAVMWDGRETIEKGSPSAIHFDLAHQSNSATQGHAQAPKPIDDATREAIVAYEMGNFTAQVFDRKAGALTSGGAQGGPQALSKRSFTFGVNDPLGCDPDGANCDPAAAQFDPIVVYRIRRVGKPLRQRAQSDACSRGAGTSAVQYVRHPDSRRVRHQRRLQR